MPPVDDYSDSDSEAGDVESSQTSVLLGIPAGAIDSPNDLSDPMVSHAGGLPVFHPHTKLPTCTTSHCKVCSNPMELLLQIWCPFENSPYDRTLFVWGCSRGTCQRKEGSVRALRALKFNEKYAKKLERKKQRLLEEERKKAAKVPTAPKAPPLNPFSLSANEQLFGSGSNLFGTSNAFDSNETAPGTTEGRGAANAGSDSDSASDDESDGPVDSLSSKLKETNLESSLSSSEWPQSPTFAPIYIDTTPEYLTHVTQPKTKGNASFAEGDGKEGQWGMEGYENSRNVDEVFERFVKRVSEEGEQCLRYELSGVPLPYTNDKVYKRLFPLPAAEPGTLTTITNAAYQVHTTPQKRTYNPSSIPPCPICGTPRTFECQLMPNLITILHRPSTETKRQTEEERRRELVEVLGKGGEKNGMEWGTCLVFSCLKDCCAGDEREADARDCWREEIVLVQWEE